MPNQTDSPLALYDIDLEQIIVDVVKKRPSLQGRVALLNEHDNTKPTMVAKDFIYDVLREVYIEIQAQICNPL